MKSPSPHTPPSRSPRRWTSCIAAAAMLAISFASNPVSAQQTFHAMSSGDYAQNFADIANWTNNYAAGIGANNWRTATSVATSTGSNFTVFVSGTSGGVQKGAQTMVFLATGANAGATDLLLNFTGRIASNLSFDYAKIANTVNESAPRTSDLKIQYSVDNGVTFTDVTGYDIPRITNNSTSESGNLSITLPAELNNEAQTVIRFYFWNNGQTGGTGSRPKWSIDNVAVTSTPGNPDNTPPSIVTYVPENSALDVPITTTELVATFDENVAKGTGNITLKLDDGDSTVMTIDVTSPAVVVSGATATITLPASLLGSTSYYVNIDAGAFKDLSDNNFGGINDKMTWAFTTAAPDITPPAPTLFPLDDSTDFVATASPTLTYDEPVVLGVGTIELRASAGGALIESFDVVTSPRVTLSGTTLRINPTDPLTVATGYYLIVPQGVVKDLVDNPSDAITGPGGWNFTTRGIPAVVISQYYEGTSSNRYLELRNTTGSPVSLDGYRIASFSPSDTAGNQGWKTGESSPRVTDLSTLSIPANGYFLIAEPLASIPSYANPDLRPAFPSAVAFGGTASIVLYRNAGFAIEDVIDVVSITTNQGTDISFYRQNDLPGFDFDSATNILQFTGASQPWATKTIAEVDAAVIADPWLLRGTVDPGALTLAISPASFLESAGLAAATATVTRSGDTTEELFVTITNSNPNAAYATTSDSAPEPAIFVSILANESSAVFDINAIDNPWLTGDQTATFTVSSQSFTSDSKQVTVLDEATDLPYPVVINEVDADQPGTDDREFIELYNKSSVEVSLDGFVLVLYNGGGSGDGYALEASYLAIDLSGQTIPANGFFVVGSALVPNVNMIEFTTNGIQNGPDAVALHYGAPATSFPNGTLASQAPGFLVDALVYSISLNQATTLLSVLTPGKPQVDENLGGQGPVNSMSRLPDGGEAFDTTLYNMQPPTPGFSNVPITFADWIAGFDVGLLTGFNDDFDNDGLANALENILGSDPSVSNQGLTAVSASAGSLVFRHTLAAEADIAVDLSFEYEWSVDLANWNASAASAGGTTVTFANPVVITPGVGGAPDLVEVTAAVTGTPASKVFARLRVDQVVAP